MSSTLSYILRPGSLINDTGQRPLRIGTRKKSKKAVRYINKSKKSKKSVKKQRKNKK